MVADRLQSGKHPGGQNVRNIRSELLDRPTGAVAFSSGESVSLWITEIEKCSCGVSRRSAGSATERRTGVHQRWKISEARLP